MNQNIWTCAILRLMHLNSTHVYELFEQGTWGVIYNDWMNSITTLFEFFKSQIGFKNMMETHRARPLKILRCD